MHREMMINFALCCSVMLCDGAGCCRIILSNHLAKLSVIVDAFLSLQSNLNLSFQQVGALPLNLSFHFKVSRWALKDFPLNCSQDKLAFVGKT